MKRLLIGLIFSLPGLLVSCAYFDSSSETLGPAELTDFTVEKALVKVWHTTIGNGQGKLHNRLRPVIADNAIYVVASNGEMMALDRNNGHTQWAKKIPYTISGGVGIGADLLLLGSKTGQIIALDRATGQQRWVTELDGEILSPPQADGEVVVVQTLSGRVAGLSIHDGALIWLYSAMMPQLTLRGTSTPLMAGDKAVVGLANGKVVAFDRATGIIDWELRVAFAQGYSEIDRLVDVDAPLLLDNQQIFAVSYQGQLTALDAQSGRRFWSRAASSVERMSKGFEQVYVAGDDSEITAFMANGEGVAWQQNALIRRQLTGSVTMENLVFVGDMEGYVHGLSQLDGHISARTRVHKSGIGVAPLVDGNLLLVYANNGYLAAYRLEPLSG